MRWRRTKWIFQNTHLYNFIVVFLTGPLPRYRFIPSSQGKHYVLLVEGSKFNQTTSNGRYWNCSKRMSSKCKARVRFDSYLNMTFYYGHHNHHPITTTSSLSAEVRPAYNVSAAITQAFSRLARVNEPKSPDYTSSSALNLSAAESQVYSQPARVNEPQSPD